MRVNKTITLTPALYLELQELSKKGITAQRVIELGLQALKEKTFEDINKRGDEI